MEFQEGFRGSLSSLSRKLIEFRITGTFHGATCFAYSEGQARRSFHKIYGGESILSVKKN